MLIRSLPKGVRLLTVPPHDDSRGQLYAIEQSAPVPFVPVRLFIIRDVPANGVRAGHAGSFHEFLYMICGSCVVEIDNGTERAVLPLRAHGAGVLVSSGVWIELREFSEGAVLSVLASGPYAETRHFDSPRPELISGFE
jgi:hypothetical protein